MARQQNRANHSVEDLKAYYRVAYFYTFLDHTLNHLSSRFSKEMEGALLATYLIPTNIKDLSDEIVAKMYQEFESVLPYSSGFKNEVSTWTIHVLEADDGPSDDGKQGTLLHACSIAYRHWDYYPNIHTILQLLLSLPVGSCSCERSFSSLRRLKTWCRNSMGDERLGTLAICYVNSERTPSPEEVLKVWDLSGHRRIAIAFQDK